jgi:hypothetical protein
MGIEYMIDLPCRAKKELGEEHMVNLVRTYLEKAPKKGVGDVETAQIVEVPTELGGANDADAKLRKDLASLDYYISECLSCPANVASEGSGAGVEGAYGCFYELPYPIRSHMETALLHSAFAAIEDPAHNPGYKLIHGIVRSHAKGKRTPAHKVRKMGKAFYESKAPKATKVVIEGDKVNLDTDQLMTLLMLGPVPTQATGAFAAFLEKGVDRAKRQGVSDPRVLAPLVQLSESMRAAQKVGYQVKIKY